MGSAVVPAPGELVPLSILQLDQTEPVEGWAVFLGRRAIVIRPDNLGRDSVTSTAARQLLDEQRELKLKQQRRLKLAEAEAVEADERRRAALWQGLPADRLPVGAHPASAMLAAAKDAQPKRTSVLEHAQSNEGAMVFHSYADEAS